MYQFQFAVSDQLLVHNKALRGQVALRHTISVHKLHQMPDQLLSSSLKIKYLQYILTETMKRSFLSLAAQADNSQANLVQGNTGSGAFLQRI